MGPNNANNSADADADGTQLGLSYSSGPLMVGVNSSNIQRLCKVDGGAGAPVAGSESYNDYIFSWFL